ncbi:MAG: hypothetical protein RIT04_473 [Candidatus Parcubacteria bacterium]|jgi:histidine triad (HIT) family protein
MKNVEQNCVFCKIIAKQIPSTTVFEDEHFLAFLSIDPRSPGHTLIIPKEHYRWVWDVPAPLYTDYFSLAKKIAEAQKKAFSQELVCAHVEGEEVPHAHIWIYPDRTTPGDKKDFEGNAMKIREALAKQG